jgi:hypothetical protein
MKALVEYTLGACLVVAIAYVLLAPSVDGMRAGLQAMIDGLN